MRRHDRATTGALPSSSSCSSPHGTRDTARQCGTGTGTCQQKSVSECESKMCRVARAVASAHRCVANAELRSRRRKLND